MEKTSKKTPAPVEEESTGRKVWKEILSWIGTIVTAFIAYLIINMFIFTAQVDGLSMFPTLNNHDYLFASRTAYNKTPPEYEDIIVFKSLIRNEPLIKRVIGKPGDHIEIKDGKVYRNDELLNEDYIDIETIGEVNEIVEEDHLFVMGDNRDNSADSRYPEVGQISYDNILGKAVARVFPNFTIFKK